MRDSLAMVVTAAKHLLRRPVAFYPALAELGGSVEAGLFLSQACYWTPRTNDDDGWFYKTQSDWHTETMLSRRQQEKARLQLVHRGLISERLAGVPARLYFRVNWERLQGLLGDLPIVQSSMAESAKQECAEEPNKNGGNSQTLRLTESTSETTQIQIGPFNENYFQHPRYGEARRKRYEKEHRKS